MPADPEIVEALTRAIRDRGGRILEAPPPTDAANPFHLRFEFEGAPYSILVHARRITPQEGEESDHGRPAGEWHAQMIFDGDTRGAGARNRLRAENGSVTVLLGYTPAELFGEVLVAAWDPQHHEEYAYSKSLQIREETLRDAGAEGVAQQARQTDEIIVAFPPEYLPEYLSNREEWHGDLMLPAEAERTSGSEPSVESPEREVGERERTTGTRAMRDVRFRRFLERMYGSCAACGLSTRSLLEAAHIIPVSVGGSDHFSNGMLLCKNCHGLFDAGLLLIRPDYALELASVMYEDYPVDAERILETLHDELQIPEDIKSEFKPDPELLQEVLTRGAG